MELIGEGLKAGEWDFVIDNLSAQGSQISGGKNIVMRIVLITNTKWSDILKCLPKGSIIKNIRQMR